MLQYDVYGNYVGYEYGYYDGYGNYVGPQGGAAQSDFDPYNQPAPKKKGPGAGPFVGGAIGLLFLYAMSVYWALVLELIGPFLPPMVASMLGYES